MKLVSEVSYHTPFGQNLHALASEIASTGELPKGLRIERRIRALGMPADERIVGMGVGALGIFVSMYIGYLAVRENPYAALVPTATVIESQSVRTTESGGVRGFDAGKKIQLAVQRDGLLGVSAIDQVSLMQADGTAR